MSAIKLTVGIPTYNRAGWLRETIASVLAQTFTSFRLIVSDNASDDDTPDVVRSSGDARIDYLRSERNLGAIGNLNRLIELAETEFLVIVPDDDVLYPDYLGAAVKLLERSEGLGLAHSAFDFIDAQSRVIRRVKPVPSLSSVKVERRDLALKRLMVSRWGLCFPSVMYRTKAIVDVGGFREEEEPFGDRKMWMRIALGWDFGYIAKPLVGFRTHEETRTMHVGADHEETSDLGERIRLHSQINFQRRMEFLDEARLEFGRTELLRALATLQLLVEDASMGIPWNEAAARLAKLVRSYPRIVLRPGPWRFVGAQLGGRRVRSMLRRASIRFRRVGQG